MRRYQRFLAIMAGAAILMTVSVFGAAASEIKDGAGPGEPVLTEEQKFMTKLEAAQDTDSLILVVGNDTASQITLSYHTKGEDGLWKEELKTTGLYGRNGATVDKKEGDGKTPLGTYQFTMAFGVKENPGSVLSYHRLSSSDYWVDDSKSRYYNQLVNAKNVKKDWRSAEHMAAVVPFYNYGLALNYNPDCVPGKGSAIFLHCMNGKADTGTSGCVKIPEEEMKRLLQTVNEKTKIVIVSDISQLKMVK